MRRILEEDPYLGYFAAFNSKELGDHPMDEIVSFAASYFQVDYVHIALLESDTLHLKVVAAYLDNAKIDSRYRYLLNGTPCDYVIHTAPVCFEEHIQELFPKDSDLITLNAEGYIGEPIVDHNGKTVGLIVLVSRHRLESSDLTASLMKMLAGRAGIELARQKTETILRKEHDTLQLILDYAPIGIWLQNGKGKIEFVNKAFTEAVGISEEEFLAVDHYMELIPDEFKPQCVASDEKALSSDTVSVTYQQLPFVDGKIHDLHVIKAVKRDDLGNPLALVGLSLDITDEIIYQKQLERIAHYDPLTGLPNRILNAERLSQAMIRAKHNEKMIAVLFLDVDGFKPINDLYGHEMGDILLGSIARKIEANLREGDTLSRLGGDEFIAILTDLPSSDDAISIVESILESFIHSITLEDKTLHITTSIGITFYPQKEEVEGDQLIRQADLAMYTAKQAGKNRYHIFDADNDQTIRIHHKMVQKIKDALLHKEFALHYQPKINLKTGRLLGAEALIRWHHPLDGIIYPNQFLPCIEDETLAIEIGEWVIHTALNQLNEFHQRGFTISMSVNVGASQLLSGDFYERLKSILNIHPQIDPRFLEIEILETSALENLDTAVSIMNQCISLGVRFSLDDFGTGYSSLSYLKKLPISTLKIDQSFVRDIISDPDDHAIVKGIIGLGEAFGKQLVAEGVETEEIAQTLIKLGCENAQGYWMAKPMDSETFYRWLEKREVVSGG